MIQLLKDHLARGRDGLTLAEEIFDFILYIDMGKGTYQCRYGRKSQSVFPPGKGKYDDFLQSLRSRLCSGMEEFSENMKLPTVVSALSVHDKYMTQCQILINGRICHKRILFMQGKKRQKIIAVCEDVYDAPERVPMGISQEDGSLDHNAPMRGERSPSDRKIAYLLHEARTSLNSICGNLDLLQKEESYGDNDYLKNAALSAAHLKEFVNTELCISMVKGTEYVMKLETVTMDELVQYPKSVFEVEAFKKRIRLDVFAEEPIYQYLYLHKMAVCQIIVNLISNAIKYTNEGGSVICRMAETYLEEKRVLLTIEVTDTGIGMEESFLSVIWEDYTRECRKKDAQGSGLGLALTKHLVELMDGRIEIASQVGCGTKIFVELEADADDIRYDLLRAPRSSSCADVSRQEAFQRALVAEDEESNREIIGSYLQELGIDADKINDGEEVIAIFAQSEENYYDVILMDINMPGMSGLEAIQAIRSMDRKDSNLPIIAMTADIDVANKQKNDALSVQINACLLKPYCLEDVAYALSKCRG
ncbi:MAG: response regulator [Lachnospiraceae bacterium]|nr:response regulator [Lachnospiraceae bacterium]